VGPLQCVSDALAPTANRCTVSLVFDIGNDRYQVARTVRRIGKSNPTQRDVVLERFADSTATGDPDDGVVDTEPVAADIKEVRDAVEVLLGLSFEDFCQCVVLPQGEFAAFLKAKVGERRLS